MDSPDHPASLDAHPLSSMFPSAACPPRPSPPQASPSTPTHGDFSLAVTALGLSQCCSLGSPSNKRVLVFESCLLHFVLCVCVCVVSWFTGEALKSYCVKDRYRMRSATLGLILPHPAHHFPSCSACLTSGGSHMKLEPPVGLLSAG